MKKEGKRDKKMYEWMRKREKVRWGKRVVLYIHCFHFFMIVGHNIAQEQRGTPEIILPSNQMPVGFISSF